MLLICIITNQEQTPDLFLICISGGVTNNRLKTLIESENLLTEYSIKETGRQKIYLWW